MTRWSLTRPRIRIHGSDLTSHFILWTRVFPCPDHLFYSKDSGDMRVGASSITVDCVDCVVLLSVVSSFGGMFLMGVSSLGIS